MLNLYKVLDVRQNAPQSAISASYACLHEKYTKDCRSGNFEDEARLRNIDYAFEILSDPVKRDAYDAKLAEQQFNQAPRSKYDFCTPSVLVRRWRIKDNKMLRIALTVVLMFFLAWAGKSYYKSIQQERQARAAAERLAIAIAAKKAEEEKIHLQELAEKEAQDRKVKEVMGTFLSLLKSTLIDPDSVQVKIYKVRLNDKFIDGEPGDYVCGVFNAKNRFGGYVGFTRFYWSTRRGLRIDDKRPSSPTDSEGWLDLLLFCHDDDPG